MQRHGMSALGRIRAALVWSGGMSETLRGLWLEVRVIPVLLWSFSALTLGTALAAHGRDLDVWFYLGAVALGVLIQGLLAPRALWWVFAGAFAATTVIGLALVAAGGIDLLPFGLVGVAGAILYTLPPVRAAYRPFLGEAIACICLWLCVTGAAELQGGT